MNIPGSTGKNWPEEKHKRLVVLGLSWAGVTPFVLLIPFIDAQIGRQLFMGYSLAILSFLCGTWWATALSTPGLSVTERVATLVTSNLLVLVAVGLFIVTTPVAFIMFAVLFGVQALFENKMAVFQRQPDYYRTMRLAVSAIVCSLQLLAWGVS